MMTCTRGKIMAGETQVQIYNLEAKGPIAFWTDIFWRLKLASKMFAVSPPAEKHSQQRHGEHGDRANA